MSAAVMPSPWRTHGMPRDGPATLVAMTSCPRRPGRAASQRPMMASVAPQVSRRAGTAYISAVSMKFTPRSTARSRMAWAVGSSTCSPKVMVPRQMGVTRRSLCPRGTRERAADSFMAGKCRRSPGVLRLAPARRPVPALTGHSPGACE